MEDVCYCNNGLKGLKEIVNCLLEKSRVSLPVLISACALGYIWIANKHQKDLTRQYFILEDDLRKIKKENLHIYDEIRSLNSCCSDSELLSSLVKSCEKSRPLSRCTPFSEKLSRRQSAEGLRNYSRKYKKRIKSRKNLYCEENDRKNNLISLSSPDINNCISCDFSLKSGGTNFSPLPISNFEWSPRAESTTIGYDFIGSNKCPESDKLISWNEKERCRRRDISKDRKCKRLRTPCSRSKSPRHKLKCTDVSTPCDFSKMKSLKLDFMNDDNYKYISNDDKSNFRCSSFKCPGLDSKYERYRDNCSLKCDDYSHKNKSKGTKKSIFQIEELCCPTKADDRTSRALDKIEKLRFKLSRDLNVPESFKCSTRCGDRPYKTSIFDSKVRDKGNL